MRVTATDADTGDTLVMMIPAASAGISLLETWDTTGMRATASHDVVLEDVLVTDAAVAQRLPPGAPMRQPSLAVAGIWFQMLIASVYLGVAEEARSEALRASAAGVNSSFRHSVLTDVLVGELEGQFVSAEAIRDQVVAQLDADRSDLQRALGRAILCRQLVVSHAVAAVEKAVELAGGRAYFRTSPLERLARDVRAARFHPPATPVSFQMVGERIRESAI